MINAKLCIAAAAALLALTACGGGGDSADADNTVPASALESPESFSRWVGERRPVEDKEPRLMTGVLPPTSDTTEPIDIN